MLRSHAYMIAFRAPAARYGLLAAIILIRGIDTCAGQSSEEVTGFYLYERLDATSNTLGFITRVDSTAGYNFSRYLAVDAGVPLYVIRPADAALAPRRVTDIGNVHLTARVTAATTPITYVGTMTLTAPTGDKDKGLSTGRMTYDWNNHVERSFGRLTPFGDLGLANTIADTPLFVRPFTSQGLVAHFEGGARLGLAPRVSVGASLYALEPSGEQTVISRVTKGEAKSAPGPTVRVDREPPPGRGRKQGVFELNPVTAGPAEIVRERGGSLWLSFGPFHSLDFQIGYTRSATYALNTVFLGVGVNVGSLILKRHP